MLIRGRKMRGRGEYSDRVQNGRALFIKAVCLGHWLSPDGKPTDILWVQKNHTHLIGPMTLT